MKMGKITIKNGSPQEEGKCPICGEELEYSGVREIDDNGSSVPWECPSCGASGDEGYTDVFDKHYNVEDASGNDVEFVPADPVPVADDSLLNEADDVIDNAAFNLLSALSVDKLRWNMALISELTDAAKAILATRKINVCHPWEDEDGHICYSLKDNRCAYCPRSCSAPAGPVISHGNTDVVMSIYDDVLRVDWVNLGEGLCGDYNSDDPNDVNLLRFDVYVKQENGEWETVDDASYCTNMPADASEVILERALRCIFDRYRDVIDGPDIYMSVKKLGEELSHICDSNFDN
jgi:hypothetical protein